MSLPQCAINMKYVGTFSPKVYTNQLQNYQADLSTMQVMWGLEADRYETYIGDMNIYSSPSVYFDDVVGTEILKREIPFNNGFSPREVVKLFFDYPIDMMGIYIRHLISLLTPVWKHIYQISITFITRCPFYFQSLCG